MILTTAVLSTSMTAPLFALLMLKIALRVPDDAALEYLTVQTKTGVFVESDSLVLQYRNIAMVILTIARLTISVCFRTDSSSDGCLLKRFWPLPGCALLFILHHAPKP